ncbi:MAG: SAM-dependent chlorinase/fluorinase [Pseudomonadales bacterium]|nr:SAM-dependent chlorinase/fluorinase [Pseudomonadales bacterium]
MRQVAMALLLVLAPLAALAGEAVEVTVEVVSISADYGNIDTDAGLGQVEALKLENGDTFKVRFKDREFPVTLGTTYSDVPEGDWVAFVTDSGSLRIARNYENAAGTLGVREGDRIILSR